MPHVYGGSPIMGLEKERTMQFTKIVAALGIIASMGLGTAASARDHYDRHDRGHHYGWNNGHHNGWNNGHHYRGYDRHYRYRHDYRRR